MPDQIDQSDLQQSSDKKEKISTSDLFEKYRLARRLIVVYVSSLLIALITTAISTVFKSGDIGGNFLTLCIAYISMYTIVISFYFASRMEFQNNILRFAGQVVRPKVDKVIDTVLPNKEE